MPDRFDPENAVPATVPFTLGKRRGIFAKLEVVGQSTQIKAIEGQAELVKRADGVADTISRADGEVR